MIEKDFIKRKKYPLLLLSLFAAIFFLLKTLVFYVPSLRVFEFAFLAMVVGFGPAYFLRKAFKFENIIGWIVNSSVLGVLFIPFLFILLGWMGINIVFVYSTLFLYIFSLAGMLSFVFLADDASIKDYFRLNGLARVDVLFYSILIAYTATLTLLNFYRVYFQWDTFTFWGLDAKYIFQRNHLRDSTYDIFGLFRYTAYYPVFYAIIYDLYGTLVEQYANWINVFLNFLAMLLVYNTVLYKSFFHKTLIVALLIVISYLAIPVVYMFSMYADILCAFNLLAFMVILTTNGELDVQMYSKRMFLLLLLAISLYFIKSPFIFLTCLLILAAVLYDLQFLLNHWRALLRRIDFWLVVGMAAVLNIMRSYYFSVVLRIGSNTPLEEIYLSPEASLDLFAEYTIKMLSWLFNTSPYLVLIWCLVICSVFLINRRRLGRNYYYLYSISFVIVLSYCANYLINQSDLTSGSLLRYCAVIIYLMPLMLAHVEVEFSPSKTFVLAGVFLAIVGYVFYETMTPMPLYERFKLSTGSYSVVLKKETTITEKTLRISGDTARILIADDFPDGNLAGNMYMDARFVRYLMMFNSVGGQYITTTDKLYEYALQQNADYILLLSYANTFDFCEKILVEDHNYLVKTERDRPFNLGECVFLKEEVFDLSEY